MSVQELVNQQMVTWRHAFHRCPEPGFKELKTAKIVADLLSGFGLTVHQGLATTGVVGVLKRGDSGRTIGLRADMDGLPIREETGLGYRSEKTGFMHACGHDGHMAMLLGAARILAERDTFNGTVYFIFQPAEENLGGAKVMVEEGLFKRFPMDRVFGLHNKPGIKEGHFATRTGAMMAAFDTFDITLQGKGTHAAMPQNGVDTVVMAAEVVNAFQTVISRRINPTDPGVVSVTQINGGDTWNVIPEMVKMAGCTRHFNPEVGGEIRSAMAKILQGICQAHGGTFQWNYQPRYPATINDEKASELAMSAAINVVGVQKVDGQVRPGIASEDFSFMLQQVPGNYMFLGSGEAHAPLHNPHFDFNDALLPIGSQYWIELVETILA
ncbi:MAG: amidohydrolase [Magnetococcales bacterium]|nr:amidohydrolase [Magnetococcales bacterium]